jgi:hypothetical protein
MSPKQESPWWSLDQALIWIATRDHDSAANPEASWLMAIVGYQFDQDENDAAATRPPFDDTARHRLLMALANGDITIKLGLEPVRLEWFDGAEIYYGREPLSAAYLSRELINLRNEPDQRIGPNHIRPRFWAENVISAFPARQIGKRLADQDAAAQALGESFEWWRGKKDKLVGEAAAIIAADRSITKKALLAALLPSWPDLTMNFLRNHVWVPARLKVGESPEGKSGKRRPNSAANSAP